MGNAVARQRHASSSLVLRALRRRRRIRMILHCENISIYSLVLWLNCGKNRLIVKSKLAGRRGSVQTLAAAIRGDMGSDSVDRILVSF